MIIGHTEGRNLSVFALNLKYFNKKGARTLKSKFFSLKKDFLRLVNFLAQISEHLILAVRSLNIIIYIHHE